MIASVLFLSAVTIFIPIFNQLQIEKNILNERRTFAYYLHEELQQYIWSEDHTFPAAYTSQYTGKSIHFQFIKTDDFIKGCVEWQNAKQKKESFCLYGLSNT